MMAGSPAYMAPECIVRQQPSRASDQYSLAITYYELRSGELPMHDDPWAGLTLLFAVGLMYHAFFQITKRQPKLKQNAL